MASLQHSTFDWWYENTTYFSYLVYYNAAWYGDSDQNHVLAIVSIDDMAYYYKYYFHQDHKFNCVNNAYIY